MKLLFDLSHTFYQWHAYNLLKFKLRFPTSKINPFFKRYLCLRVTNLIGKNVIYICVPVETSRRLFCSQKLVFNVRIKVFSYTNVIT